MTPMPLGPFVKKLYPKVGLARYNILFTYFVVEAKSKTCILKSQNVRLIHFCRKVIHFLWDPHSLSSNMTCILVPGLSNVSFRNSRQMLAYKYIRLMGRKKDTCPSCV